MLERIQGLIATREEERLIMEVDPYKIKTNKHQPRKTFEISQLYELSESIKQYGILQPLLVRRLIDGRFELISGERRLRAAMLANIGKVPVIVTQVSDSDSAVMSVIENIQRENLSCFEEAQAYCYLIAELGITQDELAKRIGRTQSSVANKMRILRLPDEVKKMLAENGLSERHARAILRLGDANEQIKITKIICDKELNVKETDKMIDEILLGRANKKRVSNRKYGGITKDVRVVLNTVKQAVEMITKSGVKAKMKTKQYDEYTEYVITIPKIK